MEESNRARLLERLGLRITTPSNVCFRLLPDEGVDGVGTVIGAGGSNSSKVRDFEGEGALGVSGPKFPHVSRGCRGTFFLSAVCGTSHGGGPSPRRSNSGSFSDSATACMASSTSSSESTGSFCFFFPFPFPAPVFCTFGRPFFFGGSASCSAT